MEERFIACRQASIYEHSIVSSGRGVASVSSLRSMDTASCVWMASGWFPHRCRDERTTLWEETQPWSLAGVWSMMMGDGGDPER